MDCGGGQWTGRIPCRTRRRARRNVDDVNTLLTIQPQWHEVYAGEKAFKKTGEWLPKATLDDFRKYLVGIKGPLTTPIGGGIRSLNVALRQELDLYVCLRPVRYFKGVPSPVKKPEDVDMVIFRENTVSRASKCCRDPQFEFARRVHFFRAPNRWLAEAVADRCRRCCSTQSVAGGYLCRYRVQRRQPGCEGFV